ncbi:MAG TPA: hypothetical protein VIE16_02760 [Phenylobacterium sp.]|jgi:hypothetical protein
MISLLLTAGVLLAAADVPAQTPPPATAQAPAAQAPKKGPDPDERVCRVQTMVGSRMPVKLCASARQEAMRKFEDRQLIEGAQRLIDPGHQ